MVVARCIIGGYLVAGLIAASVAGNVGSLVAMLIGWLGGGCLALLLALAWHLLVPEADAGEETPSERQREADQKPRPGRQDAA